MNSVIFFSLKLRVKLPWNILTQYDLNQTLK